MAIKTVQASLLAQINSENVDTSIYSPSVVELTETEIGGEIYYITDTGITAPNMSSFNLDDHAFNIEFTATTVGGNSISIDKNSEELDEEGNKIGDSCKLVVKEDKAPVMIITAPSSENAYITNAFSAVEFTADDRSLGGIKDSGINEATLQLSLKRDNQDIDIEIDGLSATQDEDGVLTFTYVPANGFTDGTYTLNVQIQDNDGNFSTAVARNFVVDTTAPSISIKVDSEIINTTTTLVKGQTDADTSIVITITVNKGTEYEKVYNPEVEEDGSFSQSVDLIEGENIIGAVATDKHGNVTETPVTITVLVDTTVPVFKKVVLEPNPVNGGKTLMLKVKVVAN